MNTTVRAFLIELARQRTNQTITYQRLSDECSLGLNMQANPNDRNVMGAILGEISTFEHNNERPLLSSLVIRAGDNYEGDGFYRLAESLGFGDWQTLKRDDLFGIVQMTETINFWTNTSNYTRYYVI